MKAGTYQGTEQVAVHDLPIPNLESHEALIKTSYAGICGTDMMIYSGLHPRALPSLVMGHEFAGTIEEIPEHNQFKVGDRVAVNPLISCGKCYACQSGQKHICANLKYLGIDEDGGFSQYVKAPIQNLHLLPPNVSNEEGALTEPLAVAIHAIRRSTLRFGDVVVILGAGPIGMLIGMLAKKAGASKVIISDLSEYRLKLAEEQGLQAINAGQNDIVSITKEATGGIGADVVFEVAGSQSTADQMVQVIKPQGEILLVSVYKKSPSIQLAKMHFNEISIKTTRCFTSFDFQKALTIMTKKEIDITSIISHKLPIEDFEKGFQLMQSSSEAMKIFYEL